VSQHTEQYERYAADARVLSEIGVALQTQSTLTVVRIPARLAEAASSAWSRDESGGPTSPETGEQSALRHAAGDLALIGLAIAERGVLGPDGLVRVEIDPSLIQAAIRTATTDPAR